MDSFQLYTIKMQQFVNNGEAGMEKFGQYFDKIFGVIKFMEVSNNIEFTDRVQSFLDYDSKLE